MLIAIMFGIIVAMISYETGYLKFRHDQELGALMDKLETFELNEYRAIYRRKGQPVVFRAKNLIEAIAKAREYGAAQQLTYSHIIVVLN
tara:strand:- start:1031 stop:1297 length:267 start_codon:yes stop_codon:yes gene_type:complete